MFNSQINVNPRNRSVMSHEFSRVPHAEIPRSSFKRSHGYKTMFDSGYLVPIYCDEALPGDSFNLRLSSVARLATPLKPFMDNLHMDFFFFAVPIRLIWDNFQKFMGEQTDPGDSTDYTVPQLPAPSGGFLVESLFDYFGIPTEIDDIDVNALHSRAYNLIWNEFFRDQNLQDSVVVDKDDGPDDDTDYVLLKRGKRHDYFTSCLPWPQKGTAIDLPLGDEAPVVTGDARTWSSSEDALAWWDRTSGNYPGSNQTLGAGSTDGVTEFISGASLNGTEPVPANLWADLSSATAATINSLRQAFQLQKLLERDARSGTRYIEILKGHFGVTSPDSRLQRPEYLGGGSSLVSIVPVAQTNYSTVPISKVGELTAIGYHSQSGVGFTKSFVEHCVLLGLVSVRADLTYQQGLRRMWSRQTKYDFYWPALAHLGEQEVTNLEIYAQGTSADDDVFGYQERWAEYRYFPSQVTGALRSTYATSLDVWHLSQEFGSLPDLDDTFIQENPPVSRVLAVTDEPEFVFDGYFDIICTRPMPVYSVPGLIDHF